MEHTRDQIFYIKRNSFFLDLLHSYSISITFIGINKFIINEYSWLIKFGHYEQDQMNLDIWLREKTYSTTKNAI